MQLEFLKDKLPAQLYALMARDFKELRPCQEKAIQKGLLERKNLLVCTPTASGKTLLAELAGIKLILEEYKKVIYNAPLKALASEKYKRLKEKYGSLVRVALSIGDIDSTDPFLSKFDLIITTPEPPLPACVES